MAAYDVKRGYLLNRPRSIPHYIPICFDIHQGLDVDNGSVWRTIYVFANLFPYKQGICNDHSVWGASYMIRNMLLLERLRKLWMPMYLLITVSIPTNLSLKFCGKGFCVIPRESFEDSPHCFVKVSFSESAGQKHWCFQIRLPRFIVWLAREPTPRNVLLCGIVALLQKISLATQWYQP